MSVEETGVESVAIESVTEIDAAAFEFLPCY